jgi:hypothetical protein
MQSKTRRTLRDSFTTVCIGAQREANEIKNDENAMEVIQVVMLIAVGVLAIAAVWAGVNGLLEQWWEQITGASSGNSGPGINP